MTFSAPEAVMVDGVAVAVDAAEVVPTEPLVGVATTVPLV